MSTAWPTVPLGEVLTQYTESIAAPEPRAYAKLSVKLYGKGVVLDTPVDGAALRMKRHQLAKAGQVILSEIWGKKGAVGFVPPEGHGALCTSHFFLFDVRTEKLDKRWLRAVFDANYLQEQLGAEARGTTGYAAVRPKTFLSCEIPLPPPTEQRRIVARIEQLAASIDEARELRQQASDEVAALASGLVGKVFAGLSARYEEREFAAFAPHVTSGPRNWAKHYEESGLRFYRAQDIGPQGKITEAGRVHVAPPQGGQGRSAMLQVGDLMLVITGATVGRVGVFGDGMEPGLVSQHVAIGRLPCDEVNPQFAWWGLRGPAGQAQLLGQRYGQGKPGLNLSNIRALKLPFPPLPEQRRVVAELEVLQEQLDALKQLQARTAAELDALLPSVLDQAFRGEL